MKLLEFENQKALDWAQKRTKKLLKKTDFERENRWAKALFEEDFKSNKTPKMSLKEVSPKIGLGLFLEEDVRALTYIGEYGGLVRKANRKIDNSNYYTFRYLETRFRIPYVIDAESQGNISRFINHSYHPNLLFRNMVVDGICHIIFYTKRACKKGEELTFNYGYDYWKKREEPISDELFAADS